ncbi:MAG: GFA family protein [Phyllobacteriaceae bacterium]|nr:GFA family protein [Phyllobacteriaceae bacterium]
MTNLQTLPPLPWHGGCQCGQERYKLTAWPLTLYACHCTECQKQSASMHGLPMLVPRNALEFTGNMKIWSRPTDSGNTTNCHFCPECGTRLYHHGTHRQEPEAVVSVKGGSLDHIRLLEPVGHIWLKSAQAGFRADPAAMCFEGQPESYEPLHQAFARRYPPVSSFKG